MRIIQKIKAAMAGAGNGGAPVDGGALTISDLFGKHYDGGGDDLGEITYYTCLKILSETMGKLPCHVVGSDNRAAPADRFGRLERLLGTTPNEYQTAAEFFNYLERSRNHFGNAYALIVYDNRGQVAGLYPLNPANVTVYINDTEQFKNRRYWYQYIDSVTGKLYAFLPEDVIHVKSWLTEPTGHVGKAAREILAEYMAGTKAGQRFLNDLYKNGLTANLAIKYAGKLNESGKKLILDRLNSFLHSRTDRVLPIPQEWDLQPLDIKLTDSQFLEIKKFSAQSIAAAFGLPPTFINDYQTASYNSSSAQNVAFYVNSLLYAITAYEMELTRKLLSTKEQEDGYRIRFNFNVILRANPETQASMLATLVNSGIYSINEARQKVGLPDVAEGNINVVNGSCKPIDDLRAGDGERGKE